ncbi:MAG: hypothetical protein KDE24_36155 [Caldilinea sp.]|nr:hypothetical protein [Caldilinea sp.]
MTPREFYEFLAKRETTGVIGFGEAAVSLRVGPQDAMAARLLLWLEETMPEDATQGDLDKVLDAAKWWSTFWASLERERNV